MEINGFDEFEKKLKFLEKEYPEDLTLFMKKEAEYCIGQAKKFTPVDSGNLKSSWRRKEDGDFTQIIYSNTDYAAHVEWGHRIIRGKRVVGFSKGKKMLHKAMNRTKLRFYKDLNSMFKEVLE